MDLIKGNGLTYVQCQRCGGIYKIPQKLPIDASIIKAECPACGGNTALNCGEDESEIYLYYNSSLDGRFYRY